MRELLGKEKSPAALGAYLVQSGGVLSRQSNGRAIKIIVDWNHIRESLEND